MRFKVLFDREMSASHLRLYGLIETKGIANDFSYSWAAKRIGVNKSCIIKMAKKLVDSGYIEHTYLNDRVFLWKIKSIDTPKK